MGMGYWAFRLAICFGAPRLPACRLITIRAISNLRVLHHLLAFFELDEGFLPTRAKAFRLPPTLPLAEVVRRPHAIDFDVKDRLDRILDVGLGRLRMHAKRQGLLERPRGLDTKFSGFQGRSTRAGRWQGRHLELKE